MNIEMESATIWKLLPFMTILVFFPSRRYFSFSSLVQLVNKQTRVRCILRKNSFPSGLAARLRDTGYNRIVHRQLKATNRQIVVQLNENYAQALLGDEE